MAVDLLVPGDGVLTAQPPAQGVRPVMPGAVWPGSLLFVNGWLDPDLELHTDVRSQTAGALTSLQAFLESHELTLADAVMLHAYIGSEAGRDGYTAAYAEFFGPHQPHKPAHSVLQVVLPAAAPGALVEIDLIAVRPTPPAHD
jgi:enamine deaminase RidA (YjgF/YER057c/UK114 family)